jgi:beta-galactosidase
VELFLNNQSLGKRPTNRSTKFMAVYKVPYAAGELKAVGYDNGKKIKTAILKTAGEATQIQLSADRKTIHSDNEDLSYVTVELVDKNGTRNPNADNLVHFTIEGPGVIAGVGNANPVSVESYQLPQRKAWHGRCMVIIKSKKSAGDIVLKATSPGLSDAEIVIRSK